MQTFVVVSLVAFASAACGGPCPSCPVPAGPVHGSGPVSAPATPAAAAPKNAGSPGDRQGIAVLRIDDDELFRAERAELRKLLASELGRRLGKYEVLSLATVDAKLVPHPKGGGSCEYDEEFAVRRAARESWFTTRVTHVLALPGQPEELWVEVASEESSHEVFTAVWNPKLPRVERYRAAFTSMISTPEMLGGLGLLGGMATRKDAVTLGAVTLCERRMFERCDPETKLLADRAAAFEGCFSGIDEESHVLVFDGAGSCELAGLDDASLPDGRREQCLCTALKGSAGLAAKAGRRRLELGFEASDLEGKPRPELRVLETSTNLDARDEWHTIRGVKEGKTASTSIRRLSIQDLDAAQAPLARCAMPRGAVVVADLQPNDAGLVTKARLVAGAPSAASAKCIERALTRVAWPCTEDGKSASLRVAVSWPE
jgi:hypothetical protein